MCRRRCRRRWWAGCFAGGWGWALAAGCDVALHCNGVLADSAAVLRACPPMTQAARGRMAHARAMAEGARQALDGSALAAERDGLLAGVA